MTKIVFNSDEIAKWLKSEDMAKILKTKESQARAIINPYAITGAGVEGMSFDNSRKEIAIPIKALKNGMTLEKLQAILRR